MWYSDSNNKTKVISHLIAHVDNSPRQMIVICLIFVEKNVKKRLLEKVEGCLFMEYYNIKLGITFDHPLLYINISGC